MIAVGDYYLGGVPEPLVRASGPFGGGVGGCRDELCGVLAGATLILGALWGRTRADEDDKGLYELVCTYRQRFLRAHGSTICRPLRQPYEERGERCVPVVQEGVRMLVELIEETADASPERAAKLARRAVPSSSQPGDVL